MLVGSVKGFDGVYALSGTAVEFMALYDVLCRVRSGGGSLSAMEEQVLDDTCAEIHDEILEE